MKILVRATNWVGDAVMCIPALEAVRVRWPEAHISILARPWVADIYQGQGLADEITHFEHAGRHRGWGGVQRLATELRAKKFDVALLLQNAFEAAWIAARAGIPERIGYARDGRSWLLTNPVPLPRPGEIPAHEIHYYMELLRRAGWLPENSPFDLATQQIQLRVDAAAAEKAEAFLRQSQVSANKLRIALAPGAAYGSAKCWLTERYAQLADRLVAAFDADVILFGSPGEREVAERISRQMKSRPVLLAGQTPIGDLPAFFSRCHIFIGNDSGAMHVAAAVGLPVVGIFGPTDPLGTRPATQQFTLVQEKVSCSPCFLRHCPVDHRCIQRVSVNQVYEAAQTWIAQTSTRTGWRPERDATPRSLP
ncbi:MAG: lipopolysaccharide heptosyltransferase II [Acidobacteria bacterium]|nr:lipopolysaccharide heptosyltransferase II [Acidobacteriota bacterium]